jgi:hypothetical protein
MIIVIPHHQATSIQKCRTRKEDHKGIKARPMSPAADAASLQMHQEERKKKKRSFFAHRIT